MTIDYVTIGEMTLDDTILESGQVLRNQTGGGAVYSALAIHLWNHSVGINASVGQDYPQENLDQLNRSGVSTEGIARIPGWSLRLWMLNEENNKKQQIPKLQSGKLADMDENRPALSKSYSSAKGYHLAPATTEGQEKGRDSIRSATPHAIISLDMLVAPQINVESYIDGSIFRGIDILSPSIVEIETLFPGKTLSDFVSFAADFGVRWIAIKMDIRGALIHDSKSGDSWHIPILPVNAVDTTGAGDCFSGGFLEGFCETQDVVEAGLRATVSASFAVEYQGAMDLLSVSRDQREERLNWLRNRVEPVKINGFQPLRS